MEKHGNMRLFGEEGGEVLFDTEEEAFKDAFFTAPVRLAVKVFDGQKTEAYLCEADFSFRRVFSVGGERISEYVNEKYSLFLEIRRRFIDGADVVRCRAVLKNLGSREVRVSKLSVLFAGGIFGNVCGRNRKMLKTCLVRSAWSGEGQTVFYDLDQLHIARTGVRDARVLRKIVSRTSYTSEDFLPVAYFSDEEKKKCWYVALEPQGCWEMGMGILSRFGSDYETVTIEIVSGEERVNGFFADLPAGGEYFTPYAAFGCTAGGIEEGAAQLNAYRRFLVAEGGGTRQPVVFNDYLNCHWACPEEEKTKRLVDAAAKIGAEVFCIDSGWYKKEGDDWFGVLGDWRENDERFGTKGFQGIVDYIRARGMSAGMWLELEVCTPNALVSSRPEEWFLHLNGRRIYEYGRYFFDCRNEEVTEYLFGIVKRFYEMGVRYIKNDYNGTFAGCETKGKDSLAGLEEHASAVREFYGRLRRELPGLMIENCCSGAMRADYTLLSRCDLQSVSDLELYERYPAVVSGSLLSLLPEQTGVWCVCYPQVYADMDDENFASEKYRAGMSDGEQTIFNMVSGFMGVMYLSGRLDLADDTNLFYVKEAVELYKRYKGFIGGSSPVYPHGAINFSKKDGIASLGLKNGRKTLLAVWRLDGEETEISISAKRAKLLYPSGKKTVYEIIGEKLTVRLDKNYQARLFEIES